MINYNHRSLKINLFSETKAQFFIDGKLHRPEEDGPARIVRSNDSGIAIQILKEYFKNGKQHRINGPAELKYDNHGAKKRFSWYQNNKLHRVGGPAVIQYDTTTGKPKYGVYYKNGQLIDQEFYDE